MGNFADLTEAVKINGQCFHNCSKEKEDSTTLWTKGIIDWLW